MKKVEAWEGLDGVVYGGEDACKSADEKFIVKQIAQELETFYAGHANDGIPMTCIAKNRGAVVEILERWDGKAEKPA